MLVNPKYKTDAVVCCLFLFIIHTLQFCEVICVSWLKHLAGSVVRIMLDYTNHVKLCCKLKAVLMEQKQWPEICYIQGEVASHIIIFSKNTSFM